MARPWAEPLRPSSRPKRKNTKYMHNTSLVSTTPPLPTTKYMIFRSDGGRPRRTPTSNLLFLGSACPHRRHGPIPPFLPTPPTLAHPSYPTSSHSDSPPPSPFASDSPNLPTTEHYVVRSLLFLPTFWAPILFCPSNLLFPPLPHAL